MRVAKYSHEKHYEKLKGWLASRDISIPERDLFSDCGFCVDDIAIGFLVRTNTKRAEIDHVAADPESSPEARQKALKMLFELLIAHAKEGGFTLITGLASMPVMEERFKSFWFTRHGEYSLYYKTL